jgi:sec-independent protein translocase protein TatB
VFGSFGIGEIAVLAVLGLVIFGPERLPTVIRDLRAGLRQVMTMARSARADLQAELGPEMADLDLASLHPRRLMQEALFGEDDEPEPAVGAAGASAAVGAGRLAAPIPLEPGERPPFDADAT